MNDATLTHKFGELQANDPDICPDIQHVVTWPHDPLNSLGDLPIEVSDEKRSLPGIIVERHENLRPRIQASPSQFLSGSPSHEPNEFGIGNRRAPGEEWITSCDCRCDALSHCGHYWGYSSKCAGTPRRRRESIRSPLLIHPAGDRRSAMPGRWLHCNMEGRQK